MNIAEVRKRYPQYNDLSDQQLADALHQKFYADMPVAEFYQKVGLQEATEQPQQRSLPAELGRQAGLAGRAMVEGVADLGAVFANPVAALGNKVIEGAEAIGLNEPGGFRFPEQSGAVSRALTQAGVPAPETPTERGVNFAGRLATGMAAGPRVDRAITATMPSAPQGAAVAGQSLDDLSRQFEVPLTAGEATGNPILQRVDTYLEQLPFVGTQGFREGQQAAMRRAAGRVVRDVGESVDDAGQAIRSSLNRVYESNKGTASKLFDRVDQGAAGITQKVGRTNRQQVAQEIMAAEANLARSGAGDDAAIVAAKNALESPELTFAEARTLRSRLLADIRKAERGEVSGSVNAQTVAALKRLEGALEADMSEWARAAGGRVERAWRSANQYYRTRVVPFKDRTIRNAMGEDFDPDKIIRTFIRPDARGTAGKLVNRLDLKGREALRYGILRDAFDDAMTATGPDGTTFFSPQKFRNSIERLGKTKERVFTPQQQAQLTGFARLAEAAKRAGQYTENPATGARGVAPAIAGAAGGAAGIAGGLPAVLAGAGGVKILSVLMTTQRGRALLTRASQYAPDSPQMANAMRAALIEVNRVIQEGEE